MYVSEHTQSIPTIHAGLFPLITTLMSNTNNAALLHHHQSISQDHP